MKRSFLCGVLFSLSFVVGCAAFSFHYYGLADVVYEHGTLLGPSEKEDLPFSKCAPNSQSKFPCVIMFTKDFFAFKQDYEDTKEKLSACQKK